MPTQGDAVRIIPAAIANINLVTLVPPWTLVIVCSVNSLEIFVEDMNRTGELRTILRSQHIQRDRPSVRPLGARSNSRRRVQLESFFSFTTIFHIKPCFTPRLRVEWEQSLNHSTCLLPKSAGQYNPRESGTFPANTLQSLPHHGRGQRHF